MVPLDRVPVKVVLDKMAQVILQNRLQLEWKGKISRTPDCSIWTMVAACALDSVDEWVLPIEPLRLVWRTGSRK